MVSLLALKCSSPWAWLQHQGCRLTLLLRGALRAKQRLQPWRFSKQCLTPDACATDADLTQTWRRQHLLRRRRQHVLRY